MWTQPPRPRASAIAAAAPQRSIVSFMINPPGLGMAFGRDAWRHPLPDLFRIQLLTDDIATATKVESGPLLFSDRMIRYAAPLESSIRAALQVTVRLLCQ